MPLRPLLALVLLASPLLAEAPASIRLDYPRLTLGELLGLQSELHQQNIVVTERALLKKELALQLPGEVDRETAIAVIRALLVLEGFELVERDGELHLTRLLEPEALEALLASIEDGPRPPREDDPPRTPVPGRVIVRPAAPTP